MVLTIPAGSALGSYITTTETVTFVEGDYFYWYATNGVSTNSGLLNSVSLFNSLYTIKTIMNGKFWESFPGLLIPALGAIVEPALVKGDFFSLLALKPERNIGSRSISSTSGVYKLAQP